MAVYTEVTDEALRAFLADYPLGELRAFRGIAEGVENSQLRAEDRAGDFILTLYEKRVDPRELPWFLGLMEHLAARGIACPLPVKARDGEALRDWPTGRRRSAPSCPGSGRAGCGRSIARRSARRWPAACGGRRFRRDQAERPGPGRWGPLLDRCRAGGDAVQPGLIAELDAALAGILAAGRRRRAAARADPCRPVPRQRLLPRGRTAGVSGLIDFYFACTDLLAYDIAVCLNAWCFEPDGSST